ncbi:MAG TPA: gluconeogenesis factor YvcK family protein [Anaerolineae bacterium]|nr:gluconeogenesis factor YvcK family protein [Anaerolineae bacterium]
MRRRIRQGPLRWLVPGMQVKRWLLVLIAGITLFGLGCAYLLRDLYDIHPLAPVFYYLTLQFIPRWGRALLFGLVGSALIAMGLLRMNQALLAPFVHPGQEKVVDALYRHRQRRRGPKVVALGGGTGLSVLLRGMKEYTDHLTAIVTVADDGGSSGRLRQELGVLPPGDFRNCIVALSDAEGLTSRLFQYRFGEGMGLNGHSFGNLFIVAMAEVTGSFEQALVESSRVLAVRGQVLPSTLQNVTLCADLREEQAGEEGGWRRVEGESSITQQLGAIERVFLEPEEVPAYPEAVKAILEADLIVAGPGSLYTSVLPNLLVPDVTRAIRASRALKVYVCNVATQSGETDGYGVEDHMRAIREHVGQPLFDTVLANDRFLGPVAAPSGAQWVRLPEEDKSGYRLVTADLVDEDLPWRHDSGKLARHLIELYGEAVKGQSA